MADVTGATIGSLKVLIGADVAGLLEGVAASKDALQEFSAESTISTGAIATLGAAVIAAGIAFAGEFVHGAMEAINASYLLGQQLGGTTEAVQTLDRAAVLTGSSAGTLEAAARRLNATLGEVQEKGAGPAYDALQRLGLSAADLGKMDLDQRFQAIATQMDKLGWSTQQESAFLKDMGLRGGDIIGVFQNGGAAIEEARHQVDDFGIGLSDLDAAKVHEAQEAFETIGGVLQGVANQLAVALAPYIIQVGNDLDTAASKGKGFGDSVKTWVDLFLGGVGNVGDAIQLIQVGVDEVEIIVEEVGEALGTLILGVLEDVDDLAKGLTQLGQVAGDVIPGLGDASLALQKNLDDAVTNMRGKVTEGAVEIQSKTDEVKALFAKPWPSEAMNNFVNQVNTANTSLTWLGNSWVNFKGKVDGNGGSGDGGTTDAAAAAAKKAQDELNSQLKSLQSTLSATEFSEDESYTKRIVELQTFLEKKMVTQDEFNDLEARAEQDHTKKLEDIRQAAFKQQTQDQFAVINMVTNTLDQVSSAMQSSGEDQFGIAKAFSVATALLKGYEAITSSYASGAAIGGPLLGAAFAAAAAVATAAQIGSLLSVTSSSSGTPKVASSAATPTAAASGGSMSTINVQGLSPGSLFTGSMVRSLIGQLVQAQKDGATLVVVK